MDRVRLWRDRIADLTEEPETEQCGEYNPTLVYPYILGDVRANPDRWDV